MSKGESLKPDFEIVEKPWCYERSVYPNGDGCEALAQLLAACRALMECDPYHEADGGCMYCPATDEGVFLGEGRRYPREGEPHHADCPWGAVQQTVEAQQ